MNINKQATHIVETSERNMWAQMMRHVSIEQAKTLGIELHDFGSATGMVFRTMPYWMMNRVIGLGLDEPIRRGLLEEINDYYTDRELPVGISLLPSDQSDETLAWLKELGFELQNVWAKMYRDNSPVSARLIDHEIVELTKKDTDQLGEVMCKGFGMPPFCEPVFAAHTEMPGNHVYGIRVGSELVAVGALTIFNDIGHLNSMTTLEEWRGRGFQGALFEHSISEGIKKGCKWFATETGLLKDQVNHSFNNMVRSGFQMAYERPNFVRH